MGKTKVKQVDKAQALELLAGDFNLESPGKKADKWKITDYRWKKGHKLKFKEGSHSLVRLKPEILTLPDQSAGAQPREWIQIVPNLTHRLLKSLKEGQNVILTMPRLDINNQPIKGCVDKIEFNKKGQIVSFTQDPSLQGYASINYKWMFEPTKLNERWADTNLATQRSQDNGYATKPHQPLQPRAQLAQQTPPQPQPRQAAAQQQMQPQPQQQGQVQQQGQGQGQGQVQQQGPGQQNQLAPSAKAITHSPASLKEESRFLKLKIAAKTIGIALGTALCVAALVATSGGAIFLMGAPAVFLVAATISLAEDVQALRKNNQLSQQFISQPAAPPLQQQQQQQVAQPQQQQQISPQTQRMQQSLGHNDAQVATPPRTHTNAPPTPTPPVGAAPNKAAARTGAAL